MRAAVQAQTTLRIGLAEDPDVLDPTLARTYVGRIVFASLCDKLFDIDEKLNIVPQLALSHETSADGKAVTIKLRPGVKFHDGEPFDAEAAKFTLERHLTHAGLVPQAGAGRASTRSRSSIPSPSSCVLKAPFSPLIAQLTDRAGMMVSPKAAKEAGDKFGLQPVCAGPYKFVERVQQDRIVFEKFADYWNKDNIHIDRIVYLPIVDATVRLANLKSGGLDLIERAAGDRHQGRARRSASSSSSTRARARLSGPHAQRRQRTRPRVRSASPPRCARRSSSRSTARRINQVVFNGEFMPGNQWVSPEHPYYQKAFPVPKRDVAKAKALLKEAGVTAPVSVDFMVPKGAETEAVAEVIQAMAAEAGFDMKIRVTEFATSLKQAEAGDFQAYLLGLERPHRSRRQYLHLPQDARRRRTTAAIRNPEVDKALDDARLVTDQAQRKAIYEKLTKIVLDEKPLHLPLSPPHADRAHHQARGLQADAGRPGARGRAEAEVSMLADGHARRDARPLPC